MSILAYQDGNIEIKKNNIIFSEGLQAKSINIMLQGEVDVYMSPISKSNVISEEDLLQNSFCIFSINQNMFIGSSDIFSSSGYNFSYKAAKDTMLYIFCAGNSEELNNLLLSHKEYGAYIMTSVSNSISLTYTALERINVLTAELKNLNANLVHYFWHLKEKYSLSCNPSSELFTIGQESFKAIENKQDYFSGGLDLFSFEKKCPNNLVSDITYIADLPEGTVEYYRHFLNIPMDIRKSFYSTDNLITITQCQYASNFLTKIQDLLRCSLTEMAEQLAALYNEVNSCIFTEYMSSASELKLENPETYEVFKTLDYILLKIQEISKTLMDDYKYTWITDTDELTNSVDQVKAGRRPVVYNDTLTVLSNGNVSEARLSIPDELNFSASKIIDYSGISKDKAQLFISNMEAFISLQDKFSTDESASNVRKTITALFFEIYEAVLKKVLQEKNQSRILHMFLTFGYMDERLLEPDQVVELYNLVDKFTHTDRITTYSMRDWLTSIYDMDREPSINEFSQDYSDVFREMKKRHEVTDKDWHTYSNNKDARLSFEINNMFKVNQRACSGMLGSYFPILHRGVITRSISKVLVTPELIEEAIDKLISIDFTVFHREISYKNPEKKIEKELIMKSITPEIILMPVFGSRASMWQEISGRNRSTPARFIIPILTDEDLFDMIVKLAGNYRWEICRTMMGVYWNDITQKSLTSEYTDYIQFYKKNRDLPEDVKSKISTQVLRYRSMMRDIFTSDYEQWINYESRGTIRLNKVCRNIFYKYCPFPKETRERLSKHPMFSEIDAKFNIRSAKQLKEIKNHYSKLMGSGITPDIKMEENLQFYMNM